MTLNKVSLDGKVNPKVSQMGRFHLSRKSIVFRCMCKDVKLIKYCVGISNYFRLSYLLKHVIAFSQWALPPRMLLSGLA